MTIFGQDINREQMPSYESFVNSPNHMYSAMQDSLKNGLGQNQPMNPQVVSQGLQDKTAQQSQQWR